MASIQPDQSNVFETRLFINGEFVEAKSNLRLTCYHPVDNSVVTSDIRVAEEEDVNTAVAAARAAFKPWSRTPGAERAKYLVRLADLLDEHIEELCQLEALCTGKPMAVARAHEVPLASRLFRYYAGWADKLEGTTYPEENGFLKIVHREPIGVCAAINAFNGPLILLAMKGAPYLAAGNTMIMKPSEKSPLATLFVGKLIQKAGFPPGVFNIVSGAGRTGALLASHMDINKVSFTGSLPTGQKIAQAAAGSNLKRVTLELGGKSPSIVFPDANLDAAVRWCIEGILVFSGQACVASSRVYVHQSIKAKFLEGLKAAFEEKSLAFGRDLNSESTLFGPLVDKLQYEKVVNYIDGGKSEATLLTGGKSLFDEGCYVAPTIFVDPAKNAKIYKEEIFGPVVVVSEFVDEDDVIERANATPFGLSAAVFTQDLNRVMRVASQVESGTMCINCCVMTDVTVPFGGVKQSGWGREMGRLGIEAYTETKTIFLNMT